MSRHLVSLTNAGPRFTPPSRLTPPRPHNWSRYRSPPCFLQQCLFANRHRSCVSQPSARSPGTLVRPPVWVTDTVTILPTILAAWLVTVNRSSSSSSSSEPNRQGNSHCTANGNNNSRFRQPGILVDRRFFATRHVTEARHNTTFDQVS